MDFTTRHSGERTASAHHYRVMAHTSPNTVNLEIETHGRPHSHPAPASAALFSHKGTKSTMRRATEGIVGTRINNPASLLSALPHNNILDGLGIIIAWQRGAFVELFPHPLSYFVYVFLSELIILSSKKSVT